MNCFFFESNSVAMTKIFSVKTGTTCRKEKSMENKNKNAEVECHKKCHECGRFLKKELWVRKDDPRKAHGLCKPCFQNYENPYNY